MHYRSKATDPAAGAAVLSASVVFVLHNIEVAAALDDRRELN